MPSLGFHVLPSPDCLVLPQPCSSTRLDFFHVIALAPLAERQRSDKKTSHLPLYSFDEWFGSVWQRGDLKTRKTLWTRVVCTRGEVIWFRDVSGTYQEGYKPRKTRCRSSSSSLGGGTVETSLFWQLRSDAMAILQALASPQGIRLRSVR